MKYKAGDKVRVRKGLIPNEMYGGIYFSKYMKGLEEEILTIQEVHSDHYTVEENEYWWSDEILEDVQETVDDLKQKDEEIEILKLELKNKDCRISYLEGQVYAYEKILAKNNTSVGLNHTHEIGTISKLPNHTHSL